MAAECGQHGASQNDEQLAHRNLLQGAVEKVIKKKLDEEHYKFIKTAFESDRDKELVFAFHTACRCDFYEEELKFIIEVIKCLEWEGNEASKLNAIEGGELKEIEESKLKAIEESKSKPIEGSELLEYLFNLPNADGYPPFHVAIQSHSDGYLKGFLERVQAMSDIAFSILINAPDSDNWSPIHKILTDHPMLSVLRLVKEKIDWSARLLVSNATALHLAIYYNNADVLDIILKDESSDGKSIDGKSIDGRLCIGKSSDCNSIDGKSIDGVLNTILTRTIVYGRKYKNGQKRSCEYWTPLQLAAMMGNAYVVGLLLKKIDKIYDSSKRNNRGLSKPDNYSYAIPALHLAAASGVPEVMQMFITDVFDPIKLTSEDRTPIHFAIDSSTPQFENESTIESSDTKEKSCFNDPFARNHQGDDTDLPRRESGTSEESETPTTSGDDLGTRPACITMLMQAGVDTWQKDNEDIIAAPAPEASTALRMWWYKAIARDTSEAKKNLNDAANAISVVAALVATASYVGPLTPPLGYGTSDPSVLDLVQTTKLAIRVFVVTNCLSFYLAIGSILFAVVPSLPMPQESLYEEWRRCKRTIGIAILFLLLAIVGVLISFAAASNVGMEDNYSWKRLGLAFYPTLVGSLISLFGIATFFIRLLRLVFDKNPTIRRLYQKLPRV